MNACNSALSLTVQAQSRIAESYQGGGINPVHVDVERSLLRKVYLRRSRVLMDSSLLKDLSWECVSRMNSKAEVSQGSFGSSAFAAMPN